MYVTKNFIFLHFPRTGGTFLKNHLSKIIEPEKSFKSDGSIANSHVTINSLDNKYRGLPVFVLLRDPISWYWSFYSHQKLRSGSRKKSKPNLIYLYGSNNETVDFENFLLRLLKLTKVDTNLGSVFESASEEKMQRYLKSSKEMISHKIGYYSILVKELLYPEFEQRHEADYFFGFHDYIQKNNIYILDFDKFPNNIISCLTRIDPDNKSHYLKIKNAKKINESNRASELPSLSNEIVSLILKRDSVFHDLQRTKLII